MSFPSFRPILLLLALAAPLAAQTVHRIWEPPFKQGIAARVEERIVTFEELRREMDPLVDGIRRESRSQGEFNQKMAELYMEVLQSLIDRVLIVKEFYKKEFRIPPSYVENELDRVLIEDFGNDRQKFLESLRAQGMTMREFRRDLEERIIVSAMRGQRRKSQSQISPERIEAFYNENRLYFWQQEAVHLRLIMLRPLASEGPDLLQQIARKIAADVRAGASFADKAKEHSKDSAAGKGGDWGWVERETLRAELAQAAFGLPVGQVSEPIALGDQVFLLYAEDRRDEGIQPLEQVRGRIEQILSNRLAQQEQKRWLERLRRDAYVRFF